MTTGVTYPYDPRDREWARAAMGQLQEDRSLYGVRVVPGLARLAALCDALRGEGKRVVLTSGSFDILHEGHSMYLEAAREFGDFLVVGVDSDAKIRARKGTGRPAVPEYERMRMVTHQRGVGAVVLKSHEHAPWELIRATRPDTLVATEETYKPAEIEELEGTYCGEVRVLARMATVSTSARLRLLQLDSLQAASADIADRVRLGVADEVVTRVLEALALGEGGGGDASRPPVPTRVGAL